VKKPTGTLALLGGGEWTPASHDLDVRLLELAASDEVLVVPTASAFEHPERVVERAGEWFGTLGAKVRALEVENRRDAQADEHVAKVRAAKFVYVADGSPLHLRSVLKGSALYDALVQAYVGGAVVAASGAGATVLCDPMVDPRGGAYTVGLGIVQGIAVFPYHGSAADHLRERSVELLPPEAVLVGVDEHTALVREGAGDWQVAGGGVVTVYRRDRAPETVASGATVDLSR
jgi:cyanophycinase